MNVNLGRKRRRPMAEINVVPYIDVMLVLLIIFMVTTPLLSQGVKVKLPQAQAQTIADQTQPIIVTVDAKGQDYLSTSPNPNIPIDPITLHNLVSAQLKAAKREGKTKTVLVRGDARANYGKIMNAMVLLQQAGAPSVGLITQPTPTS